MGIEKDIDRIATALETIAEVQSRMLTIAEWNKDRLARKDVESGAAVVEPGVGGPAEKGEFQRKVYAGDPAVVQRVVEAAKTELEGPAWTYDDLKAALVARGIEIPKGTKMTTLLKLWEKRQSDPIIGTAAVPVAEPVAEEPEAAPAEAPEADIFGDSAPAKEEKKPMTAEEARAILTADFSGTPEDKQMMLSALAKLGVTKFSDVPEGKFEELVAAFKALKGGKK